MAKSKKIDALIPAAYRTYERAVVAALAGAHKAEQGLLARLCKAAESLPPVTMETWRAYLAGPLKLDLSKMYAGPSLHTLTNKIQILTLAYTNGLKPVEKETLNTFCDRIRIPLKEKGFYTPRSKPARKAASKTVDKPGQLPPRQRDRVLERAARIAPEARTQEAALLLAGKNETLRDLVAWVFPAHAGAFQAWALRLRAEIKPLPRPVASD